VHKETVGLYIYIYFYDIIQHLLVIIKVINNKNKKYRGADKSLDRPTSLSIVLSVQRTGGSPTGPDPENRVGVQGIGSPGRSVSSGLQVPGKPFPSW
jgi:hypothetical protein